MAGEINRYTGAQVAITFGDATGHFQSIDIAVTKPSGMAAASSATTEQRFSKRADAKITLKGWDVGTTGDDTGLAFADLAGMVLSETAPTAFSWTDTAETPATRLPASFFTTFPIANMKVVSTSGGSGDAEKASEWTADIEVNFIDVAAA